MPQELDGKWMCVRQRRRKEWHSQATKRQKSEKTNSDKGKAHVYIGLHRGKEGGVQLLRKLGGSAKMRRRGEMHCLLSFSDFLY